MENYQNLKLLKLLPLSIYFELHDILLFHSLLPNQFDIQSNDYVDKIKGTRTRRGSRGNFQVKDGRLKKQDSSLSIQSIQQKIEH